MAICSEDIKIVSFVQGDKGLKLMTGSASNIIDHCGDIGGRLITPVPGREKSYLATMKQHQVDFAIRIGELRGKLFK